MKKVFFIILSCLLVFPMTDAQAQFFPTNDVFANISYGYNDFVGHQVGLNVGYNNYGVFPQYGVNQQYWGQMYQPYMYSYPTNCYTTCYTQWQPTYTQPCNYYVNRRGRIVYGNGCGVWY